MTNRLAVLLFIIITSVFGAAATSWYWQSWSIADDYQVRFDGSGANGTFKQLEGTIQFEPDQLSASRMNVRVAVASIDTGNKTKDKHARGSSWFDAENYPTIAFRSTSFKRKGADFTVTGTLEMHGVRKTITIPFQFSKTGQNGLFTGAFTVDRKDFGMKGPLLGAFVGNEFTVKLRVPVQPI